MNKQIDEWKKEQQLSWMDGWMDERSLRLDDDMVAHKKKRRRITLFFPKFRADRHARKVRCSL